MRYQPLPHEFHAGNRKRLVSAMNEGAIALIDTSEVQYRAHDVEFQFRPDPNFYYLTGLDEPESVLLLVPGSPNASAREILFTSGTSEFVGTWEGQRLTSEAAANLSGITTVMPLSDLPRLLDRLLERFRIIYTNSNDRARLLRHDYPMHELRPAAHIVGEFRTVKDPVEVDQIRRSIDVTKAGLERAWAVMKPGLTEYALEAELVGEFIRRGAGAQGFLPIIATGKNATIIHYTKNDAHIGDHDLVLFDVSAEIGWYAADVSRVVPASGHFTDRQRAVYEALRRTQAAGITASKPGATILSVDDYMREVLEIEVRKLGLKGPLNEYYPGHISHHLGLDVHDTGSPRLELKPGMVITCEPGLYVKDEGIGIRLEDDLLITEKGNDVLSSDIPSDPDKIEKLLQP